MISFPFIVADIGGTNARFGLVTGDKDEHDRFLVHQQKVYPCADYKQFDDVFANYLAVVGNKAEIKEAAIAIAGPVIGDEVQMTNLSWRISTPNLCRKFGFNSVKLINDFGALAYVITKIKDHERIVIHYGKTSEETNANKVILGPGTGLGVAGLVKTANAWQPVCGEGGHVSFAAISDHQSQLRKSLLSLSSDQQHLSIENIISGPGIERLYRAHCKMDLVSPRELSAAQITTFATKKRDKQCINAMHDFSRILGATAGDIALSFGAFGGVYLSGGILPKIIECLDKQALIKAYSEKGPQKELLQSIPIYLITAEMPALVGAAHWLFDTHSD